MKLLGRERALTGEGFLCNLVHGKVNRKAGNSENSFFAAPFPRIRGAAEQLHFVFFV